MLLGNKKTQENERNWCLVLNSIQSEIDKKKIAKKISDVFSLSVEEANDLVSNTPIILLDNLHRSIASKVKDFFQSSGAEVFLTNDIFLKRKCYRTVWPETPNLSFLGEEKTPPAGADEQQVLGPDEAVREMRSQEKKPVRLERQPSRDSFEQLSQLKKECENWQKKLDGQQQEYAKLQRESQSRLDSLASERSKEIQKQKLLLANTEERYEALKEEYRQARHVFEEKTVAVHRELQEWKKKAEDLNAEKDRLDGVRKQMEQDLQRRTQRCEELDKEFRQIRNHLDAKLGQTGQEVDSWRSKADELSKKIHDLDQERSHLEQQAKEQAEELKSWQAKYEEVAKKLNDLESSRHQDKNVFEDELRKIEEFQRGQKELEDINKSLEISLKNQNKKFEENEQKWLKERRQLEEKLSQLASDGEETGNREQRLLAQAQEFKERYQGLEKTLQQRTDEMEALRSEFGRLRSVSNEKEAEANRQITDQNQKIDQMARRVSALEQEKLVLGQALNESSRKYELLQLEFGQLKSASDKKMGEADRHIEGQNQKIGEMAQALTSLEQEKLVLEQTLNETSRKYELLQEQHNNQQLLSESEKSKMEDEIIVWKARIEEMSQRVHALGQEKALVQQTLNERIVEANRWQDQHKDACGKIEFLRGELDREKAVREAGEEKQKELDELKRALEKLLHGEQEKYAQLQKESHDAQIAWERKWNAAAQEMTILKSSLQEARAKIQTLETTKSQFAQELELRSEKLRQWEHQYMELERKLVQLEQSHDGVKKLLEDDRKQIETQERELESNRRQIRDLHAQMEQRDVIQKRMQLAGQLAEKESRLKDLVKEQERIEVEIREREETMRKVLVDQEKVEKEIIEGKQAQRHYLEQTKKEKTPRFKIASREAAEAETEPANEERQSTPS